MTVTGAAHGEDSNHQGRLAPARIVFWIIPPFDAAVRARVAAAPGADMVEVQSLAELPDALKGADAMISAGSSFYSEDVAKALKAHGRSLRWFQTIAVGNDGFDKYGVPRGVLVTGPGSSSSAIVAEHAMAFLLSLSRRIPSLLELQARCEWKRGVALSMSSLSGKTLLVFGFGGIGRAVAERARAFGMRIVAVRRSAAPHPLADRVYGPGDLREAVAEADAIVLAASLNSETRRIFDANVLAACRPTAVLINVGRGDLLDQAALVDTLERGRLAGAGLDVVSPEPLPADSPLWRAPNLIISPHCAGAGGADTMRDLAETVGRNLDLFLAGQPLTNVLDIPLRI